MFTDCIRQPFNSLVSGQPRSAAARKVKPFWISMKQEIMQSQWHQLDHMQIICTSLQTDNYASTSSLNFLQAGWCSLQQCQSTEDKSQKLVYL